MMKFAILATILFAAAGTAFAQDTAIDDSDGFRVPVQLPADVAKRVAELRSYGERFEAAARLIEQQSTTPSWGWNSCEHEDEQVVVSIPES